MKILFFLVLMATNLNGFFGLTQDSTKVFFNEAQLSLNHRPPLSVQQNTWGFGGGLYHVFKNRKHLHWVAGIAYNYTQIFNAYQYNSHFSHYENVLSKIHYASLPLSARIVFGKKIQVFAEPGVFVDFSLGGRYNGTYYSNEPDSNGILIFKQESVNGKTHFALTNPGASFALGGSFPIQKHRLTIKTEFKLGLVPIYSYLDQILNVYYRFTVAYSL